MSGMTRNTGSPLSNGGLIRVIQGADHFLSRLAGKDSLHRVERAEVDNASLHRLLELQHGRTQGADAAYVEAHPRDDLYEPDLGAVVGWLMSERDLLTQQRDAWRRAAEAAISFKESRTVALLRAMIWPIEVTILSRLKS